MLRVMLTRRQSPPTQITPCLCPLMKARTRRQGEIKFHRTKSFIVNSSNSFPRSFWRNWFAKRARNRRSGRRMSTLLAFVLQWHFLRLLRRWIVPFSACLKASFFVLVHLLFLVHLSWRRCICKFQKNPKFQKFPRVQGCPKYWKCIPTATYSTYARPKARRPT